MRTKPPRPRQTLKSSLAARRLIRAALRRHGTQRAAARALRLPNHGQLGKMLTGQIADTPAMRAALARADARAARAWAMMPRDESACIDAQALGHVLRQIARLLAEAEALIHPALEPPDAAHAPENHAPPNP